jgi:NAD(P)-dependent dehydrogenase (short-subunit alcohol dehydrogenase family)
MSNIVMTGATSGIGLGAAERLIANGHSVNIGARGSDGPAGATMLPLELSDLTRVREFAVAIEGPLDSLILNGGMQVLSNAQRSADGFELTFTTNHLAHYLLARLLLPRIVPGGRIIFTTSGTHDPAEKTGIPAPRHANAGYLANPDSDPDHESGMTAGLRAYSSSKLCNLMTARWLAQRPETKAKAISVHAYDPGFIPATGLARKSPWPVRKLIMPLLALLPPGKGSNRLADGAAALAGLGDGSIDNKAVYMALRRGKPTWPEPSELARDDTACAKLWADSAAMVGLTA